MTVIEFLQGKLREINNQDYVSVSNHYIKSKLEEWIHDEQEAESDRYGIAMEIGLDSIAEEGY